jgi:ketohexokinase
MLKPSRVPHFPKEDTKLRAQTVTRRRGGNTANSLQVLSDILAHSPTPKDSNDRKASTNLHIIAVLPDEQSQDAEYIRASIPKVHVAGLYRPGQAHAASSMIIQSKRDDTRTIVSHGSDLPEMTSTEFVEKFRSIAPRVDGSRVWVHFEGRVPDVTGECVGELRKMRGTEWVRISVECEKPERMGLEGAAEEADVVFYSRLWAEVWMAIKVGNWCADTIQELYGDTDPTSFLEKQIHRLKYTRPKSVFPSHTIVTG